MANDGRHAKPKSGVFSQPAQQPKRESGAYRTPAGTESRSGYTEYQPRRESSATRFTQRPDPAQTRQPNRYTERVVRQNPAYPPRPAERPTYTERPVSRQPYAAILLFLFLAIKAFLLMKWQ